MKLEFWGATREVTGSCFLIEVKGRRLLVECGLQSHSLVTSFQRQIEAGPIFPGVAARASLKH